MLNIRYPVVQPPQQNQQAPNSSHHVVELAMKTNSSSELELNIQSVIKQ